MRNVVKLLTKLNPGLKCSYGRVTKSKFQSSFLLAT